MGKLNNFPNHQPFGFLKLYPEKFQVFALIGIQRYNTGYKWVAIMTFIVFLGSFLVFFLFFLILFGKNKFIQRNKIFSIFLISIMLLPAVILKIRHHDELLTVTQAAVPNQFTFISGLVVEPDAKLGTSGQIWVWIRTIESGYRPISVEIPYSENWASVVLTLSEIARTQETEIPLILDPDTRKPTSTDPQILKFNI